MPTKKKAEEVKEVKEVKKPAAKAKAAAKKVAADVKAEAAKVEKKVAAKKPAAKKAAPKNEVIIQSPMGGEITPAEIQAKVGPVDQVYVRVDENKLYWVKGKESGSVEIWE
jgi:hypothetical protein